MNHDDYGGHSLFRKGEKGKGDASLSNARVVSDAVDLTSNHPPLPICILHSTLL